MIAAIGAAAILMSACGGTEDAGGSTDAAPESPLAEFIGDEAMFDPEAGQEQFAEEQRQMNEQVVACMAAEGWEYVPEDVGDFALFEGSEVDGLEWGSREWTEKYGFGITTQMFPQETVGPELVGYPDEGFGPDEEYTDPNAEYVDSLSEADREAYYNDLYGSDPGPDITEGMSDEEMDAAFEEWEANRVIDGCFPQAEEEFYGGPNDFYVQFSDELDDMWEQMMNDPRIVEVEAGVAECVSDKGLTYSSMDDVYEDFYERAEPMQEQVWNNMPELTEEEYEAMTDAELDAMFNQPPELSPEVKAELGELQAEEIALAIAVDDCGGGQREQEDLFNEVRIEYEQNFVDSNRERLEQFQDESGS